MRQRLTGPAHFITHHALRLSKGTPPSAYIFLLIGFATGISHALVDVGTGLAWSEAGSVSFFLTQAVGSMVDHGFQTVFFSWRDKPRGGAPAGTERLLTRYVGYFWVMIWMGWSGPALVLSEAAATDWWQAGQALAIYHIGDALLKVGNDLTK